jgi:hypothetical protein
LFLYLEQTAINDKKVMGNIGRAQVMQAQAQRLSAATAAAEARVMKAKLSGLELPPGLVTMFGTD